MTENQFDQFFRDRLDPYASPVNSEVLDRVFRERDKRKTRPGGLWYILPALLLLTGVGYYALQLKKTSQAIDAKSATKSIAQNKSSQAKNSGTDNSNNISSTPDNSNAPSQERVKENDKEESKNVSRQNAGNSEFSKPNSQVIEGNSFDDELNTSLSKGNRPTRGKHVWEKNRGKNNAAGMFVASEASNENSTLYPLNRNFILDLDPSLLSLSAGYDLTKASKKLTLERGAHFPFCIPDCSFPGCPNFNGPRRNDWYLELYASFDMPFKQLGNNAGKTDFVKRKDSTETMIPSYSFGFNLVKNITPSWLVKTGLRYSQINERFDYKNENERRLTTVITIHTIIRGPGDTLTVIDTSFVEQTGTREKRTYNKYRNIDIPLILSYEMRNPNFTIGVQAGILFNLKSWYAGDMLDTSLVPMSQTAKDPKSQFKTNMGLGVYAGVSFIKPVSETWEVYAEPYFKRYLDNHAASNAPFTQVLGSYGIQLGMRYKLNGGRQQNY